jgi:UDP-2-acetamido-3-amino-2,3-dideoxy-glucuronate N-acetyltransferase
MTLAPRVGLLGHGQWGKNLGRNLARLGALRMVSDLNPAVLSAAAEAYDGVEIVTNPLDLLRSPSIDAVVIATPAASHEALARQALEGGKHVMVEKPLALTVREGVGLVTLAAARGLVLMVGHLLEYHPAVEKLRELVAHGTLGRIYYLYSNRLNLGRIRTEENALWSFAPHDVHVLLRLLGEFPEEVACHGGSYLNAGVADVTMSVMRFTSNVRAHIFVSWLHPFKDHKLVVVGDRKMAVFDDTLTGQKLVLYPHHVDWIERAPVAIRGEGENLRLPAIEPLEVECRHFLECVRTGATPRTDGASALDVLRVLEMCQRSLESGGIPIKAAPVAPAVAAYTAHPSAVVDAGAEIGEGTRIWHYSHVMRARIGRTCSLGQNVFVANGVVIGNNVKIQNNVSVYEGVTLEDDVFCGPSMVFTNVTNPRSHVSRKHEYRSTLVRRGATIGANATIVCGHTIGEYAFVAAGALVTHDVPDYALVMGVPARVVGWMCRCGVRLAGIESDEPAECACKACGEIYRRVRSRMMSGAAVEPV